MNLHMRRTVQVFDDQTPFQFRELWPFVGAIVTGAIGGCVACIQQARTRRETVAAYAIAYAITGAFGALMIVAAATVFYPETVSTWADIILTAGGAGVGTSLAVAAGNLSMRFAMKKRGWKATVIIERDEPNGSK